MRTPLSEVIKAEIDRFGFISFARFMELALYCPELGYYRRKRTEVFGMRGDFYTAGQLQPLFGQLLTSFVGSLGHVTDILDLGAGRQDLRASLTPWNYQAFDWDTAGLPGSLSGLVIANEFFDALPVHLLRKRRSGWRELVVTLAGDQFTFDEKGSTSSDLLHYAAVYGASVPDGGLLEAALSSASWMHRLSDLLNPGDLLVIDYGHHAGELARFPEGTLRGYQRHRVLNDVLTDPGSCDITAHVNFTYLRDCALRTNLKVVDECSLAQWALRIWNEQELESRWSTADGRWRLQWKQLVFGMGDAFRVLHLRKHSIEDVAPK